MPTTSTSARTTDGYICIASKNHLFRPDGTRFANGEVIDLDRTYKNLLPSSVYVEQLIADNSLYSFAGQPHTPATPYNLEIDYASLNYTVPQKVHFRYLLDGHDKNWQGPVARLQAFYTDLAPSTYRFHVRACNNSGIWNDVGAVAEFVVEPMFYQTLWFKVLIAAAIAGLLWTLYLLRLKQATASVQKRVLAQVEEKERIARELHDTLLQGFQGVALQVQGVAKEIPSEDPLRRKIEAVLDRADEVLLDGRQRVRSLRQRTADEDDLPRHLEKCGQELCQEHAASFTLSIIGTPKIIEAAAQGEICRIAKEAVTNAFLHASASKIEVEITYDSNLLSVRIRDDGSGIDKALMNGHPNHWGLAGMRERSHSIGAELKIWSRESVGTEVELEVPASIAYPRKASKTS